MSLFAAHPVGDVLADHDAGEVDVRAGDGRHDRRIDHAQVLGRRARGSAGRPPPSRRRPAPSAPCRRDETASRRSRGRTPRVPRPSQSSPRSAEPRGRRGARSPAACAICQARRTPSIEPAQVLRVGGEVELDQRLHVRVRARERAGGRARAGVRARRAARSRAARRPLPPPAGRRCAPRRRG